VPGTQASFACCDRCAALGSSRPPGGTGPDAPAAGAEPGSAPAASTADPDPVTGGAATGSASAVTVARRRLLKAAISRPLHEAVLATAATAGIMMTGAGSGATGIAGGSDVADDGGPAISPDAQDERTGFADVAQLQRTVTGTVLDVSPHVLVIGADTYEQRFTLTADATAWRGYQVEPAALRQGDSVVVRLHPARRQVADRIWASIGRVTGVIVERSGGALTVDEGATRPHQVVAIPPEAAGRIQVRFPTLEPGYLIDIIGLRQGGELIGMVPATSQPSYPATRMPAPPLVNGHVSAAISGSATWHEPRDEPPGVLGVAYPALDPETGCAEDVFAGARRSPVRMPYLAIGSVLRVRNDCTGKDCLVPVTGCASIARLFNDRCVTCGTSPRGRIADLTLASFVALGGELERGCFNATITMGG